MASHQHRSSALVFGMIVLLLVLAIVSAVIAAVQVFSERNPSTASPWVSPLAAIKVASISPALALGSLADIPDQTTVERAVAGGKPDTAFATLLYTISLTDQVRVAGLLTLSGTFAAGGTKDSAALAAATAVDIAILSPSIPDYNRAVFLAQAGQALARAGKTSAAAHASAVAAIIAEYSGRIEASYRKILLEDLANDAVRAGRKDQATALRAAGNADPPPPDPSRYVLPLLLVPLQTNGSAAWAELDAIAATRIAFANALIAALGSGSQAASEPARTALQQALMNEDRLRDAALRDGMVQSDSLLPRIAFARSRVEWQALKWRVARQGFGISLVPAWENQASAIEADLYQSFADYYSLLRDAAASLPKTVDAAQGAVDVIQDQIKWARIGFPPSAQEGELVSALDQALRERMDTGVGYLSVSVKTDNGTDQLTVVNTR